MGQSGDSRRAGATKRVASLLATGCLALLAAAPAEAQTPQPSGTVGDQFERPPLPTSQRVAPYRIERPGAEAANDQLRFPVRQIVVDGAHSLPGERIAELTAPLEGRILTFGDLAALADRITALYAANGYALSFAILPEQTVTDGVVRLRVVEGSLDALEVQFTNGSPLSGRRRVEAAVRRRLAGLVFSGPVRTAALERAILGIDDLAGFNASVVVRPSATTEGAASLTVLIESDPVDLALGSDNRLRSEFGREVVFASIALGSTLLVGDRLEVSTRLGLDPDAFAYASFGYEAPIGDGLGRFYAGYSLARTRAQSGLLGLLEFEGEETSFRAGLRYPLIRSRARSLYVSAELGGVDTRSSLFDIPIVRDNVRTLSIGVTYDWADGTGALSLFSARFVQGLEAFGATDAANPLRSRSQGRPDARFVTARFYRDQPVAAGIHLRLDSEIQFLASSRALLAASECTFGGPALGRGFDAGVLSGDECVRAGLEVARPTAAGGHAVEPYAFIDVGLARQQGTLEAGELREDDAVSYGFGLRLFTRFGFNADLQLAWPGRRFFTGDEREPRFFFTLSYQR